MTVQATESLAALIPRPLSVQSRLSRPSLQLSTRSGNSIQSTTKLRMLHVVSQFHVTNIVSRDTLEHRSKCSEDGCMITQRSLMADESPATGTLATLHASDTDRSFPSHASPSRTESTFRPYCSAIFLSTRETSSLVPRQDPAKLRAASKLRLILMLIVRWLYFP